MPQPKRSRLKKPVVEIPGEAPPATNSAETPAQLAEGPEIHKEIRKDPSQEEISGVGLIKQGEVVVSHTQTHTHTPTSTDAAADAAAAAVAAEAAIKGLTADVVITRHMAVAAGGGLIPLPGGDFA